MTGMARSSALPSWLHTDTARPALAFLAESVSQAHRWGPSSWVLTCRKDAVRLDVGQVAVLSIRPDEVDVYVAAPVHLGPFESKATPPTRSVYSHRAVPSRIRMVSVPLDDASRIQDSLLAAHHAAIEAAARAKRGTPWRRSYSEALLKALEHQLGRAMPRPGYTSPTGTESDPVAWVVKGQPGRNDFARMLRPGRTGNWETARLPRTLERGQRIFFWSSSPVLQVVGLGEVASPRVSGGRAGKRLFGVRYLTEILDQPLGQRLLRDVSEIRTASFLKAGASGTLFPLTQEQSDALLSVLTVFNPGVAGIWQPSAGRGFPVAAPDIDPAVAEGGLALVRHYRRERSRELVRRKKRDFKARHGRLRCEACAFDFEAAYGDLGVDTCEVHHIKPLSDCSEPSLTSLDDLAIVCANCHRVIHRSQPPATIPAIRRIIRERSFNQVIGQAEAVTR